MDSKTVHSLTTEVPTISRRVNIQALSSMEGGRLRSKFMLLTILPIIYAFDKNGGLFSLGFSRGPTLERQFKMRPDYATGKLFAAERRDLPAIRQMQ